MKRFSLWITIVLAAGCLASLVAGCKREQPSEWKTSGTRVSLSELREAFEGSPDKDVQGWLSDAAVSVHYGAYANALSALNKLASHPGATAKQKQVAEKVSTQIKALAAKAQASKAN